MLAPKSPQQQLAARTKSLIDATIAIGRSTLAEERDLLTSKWPEYAFMSPYDATLLFWRVFWKNYRAYVRRNVDIEVAERTLAGHSDLEPRPGQIFTQTWKARAKADGLGVSYETYIEHSFAFAERRKRRTAPWVNQLEGGSNARDHWALGLEKLVLERHSMELGRIELPQFRLKHHRNLPAQRAFRETLTSDALTNGPSLHRSIARFVCQKRQLPLHAYLRRFERDVVLYAFRSIDRNDPEVRFSPAPALSIVDSLQSCFGIPGAADASVEPCANCPQLLSCQRMADIVEQKITGLSGSADPRLAAKREKGRLRVEKHRAKKALGASGSVAP